MSQAIADPARGRRADAQRNLGALVEAAKTVFAEGGVDAPAKAITDRAGVGVGTLYRHFPRRSDLIVAVLQHEMDECVAAADELARDAEPWDAVVAWLLRFADFVGTKQGLAAALHSGDPAYEGLPKRLFARLEPAFAGLLARAVAARAVRADVSARDAMLAVVLICQSVRGEDAGFPGRMTRVFIDGLRA